jgi:enoyl-CoA hydratase/carnithine racemase
MNPGFFTDLHEAFDRLERESPTAPVVLTGTGCVFSAGLDFEYCFPLFARRDQNEVNRWFRELRRMFLRVYQLPQPTVAAINGHALAGGLVLALCCDFRVAARGDAQLGVNEVPVGVPMPSVVLEIVRSRMDSAETARAVLTGERYSIEQALERGFIDALVPAAELAEHAARVASALDEDCLPAYAHSKKVLQAPTLKWIEESSEALDATTLEVLTAPASTAAQARALARLKQR